VRCNIARVGLFSFLEVEYVIVVFLFIAGTVDSLTWYPLTPGSSTTPGRSGVGPPTIYHHAVILEMLVDQGSTSHLCNKPLLCILVLIHVAEPISTARLCTEPLLPVLALNVYCTSLHQTMTVSHFSKYYCVPALKHCCAFLHQSFTAYCCTATWAIQYYYCTSLHRKITAYPCITWSLHNAHPCTKQLLIIFAPDHHQSSLHQSITAVAATMLRRPEST